MDKVPQLRFPEFNGEWEEKKLGELLDFKNGINAAKEQYGKGIKFINVLDILSNNFITYDNIIGKVDVDNSVFEKNIVEYGDVLFQRSSETREEVGMANVYLDKKKKATFGGFVIRGKKTGEYNPVFINKLLKSKKARAEITSKSGGSTRYNIGQDTLSKVALKFPEMNEQQKIADFFTLLDQKIEKQQQKIEHLERYKKGIMQQLFSRTIRFKDENGNDYPEWKKAKISDILDEKIEKSKISNQYEVISSTTSGLYLQKDYFSREIASKDNAGYKILRMSQIVLSPQNLWMRNININNEFQVGIVSPSYKIFEVKTNFDSNFIGYLLRTPRAFFEYTQASEQGASIVRRNLNIDLFMGITFGVPSIDEQQKIVKLLTKLDSKLEKQKGEIALLKIKKKGLMQKMFV